MQDLKSYLLSAFSSLPTIFGLLLSPNGLTIITSIIMPIVFFLASKTIDVLIQLHKEKRKTRDEQ